MAIFLVGKTWKNLEKPGKTWKNLGKPGKTWENLEKPLAKSSKSIWDGQCLKQTQLIPDIYRLSMDST
jgi:hypothetical protein